MEDDVECTAYCFSYAIARSYGPKLPALLSVLGSYVVIREVIASQNLRDRSSTIPRLLLAMSISDLFFSIPYIFTTWAMPPHENLYQSVGTIATCTVQGASLQLGVSTSPLFSVAISFVALLMIRYQWRPARIFVVELFFHTAIWSYGLLATVPFIVWGMYNPTSTSCWIASYPHHCGVKETDAIECIRGEGVEFWRAFFAFFPTWPCILVGLTNMVLIYLSVRKMETRNLRWRRNSMYPPNINALDQSADAETAEDAVPQHQQAQGTTVETRSPLRLSEASRLRSQAVATQAIFYTCAFLLTFSLDTIVLLWNVMTLQASHLLITFAYILFPMQGCFNCIVYVRTANLCTTEGRLFRRVFFCCVPLYRHFFAVEDDEVAPDRRQKSSSSARHPRSSSSHRHQGGNASDPGSLNSDDRELQSMEEDTSHSSRATTAEEDASSGASPPRCKIVIKEKSKTPRSGGHRRTATEETL